MKKVSKEERIVMNELLAENKLTADSVLYCYTSKKYLEKDEKGDFLLLTKTNPVDMVIDRYHRHYHTFIAHEIGHGLSFISKQEKI